MKSVHGSLAIALRQTVMGAHHPMKKAWYARRVAHGIINSGGVQVLLSRVAILSILCQGRQSWRKGPYSTREDTFTLLITNNLPPQAGRGCRTWGGCLLQPREGCSGS